MIRRTSFTFAAVVAVLLSACHETILNSNDKTGGPCRDGNELCTWCGGEYPVGWPCVNPGDTCGSAHGECWPEDYDPSQGLSPVFGAKRSDAGADAR